MRRSIAELEAAFDAACTRMEELTERYKNGPEEKAEFLASGEWSEATAACKRLEMELEEARASARAREQHIPVSGGTRMMPAADGRGMIHMSINEHDRYEKRGRSFFADMYAAQIGGDLVAQQRLLEHQEHELEKRSMTSSTFGGLIPPQYLLELYAKAGRSGRHFVDSVNQQELPDTGMSLILPRLTQGTAAGIQATENATVSTQDAVEVDLTIPVRTIAGYVPVSRQGIERAQYNQEILFEDLVARNWATLESQAINGSGSSGQHLGMNQTTGIEVVPLNTWTIANFWGAVADALQRIATNVGGIGYEADTICMHPRRWSAIASSLDAQDRPLLLPNGAPVFNQYGSGEAARYGAVGEMFGLKVVTSTGIPTNITTGGGENEDIVFVYASQAVHVWERPNDPVALAFEQTAADALTVHLICYSYSAWTAGRYPGASAVITGGGLEPPTYGERSS